MEPTLATIALSRKLPTAVSLTYSSDEHPGISRRRSGRGWSYKDTQDRTIRDRATIKRINSLAIPPAYSSVWISPSPVGHIQATGRDAKGRKQYRYHEQFRALRDGTKYEHMMEFAASLPGIRATVNRHMSLAGLPREKVLATIVHLLDDEADPLASHDGLVMSPRYYVRIQDQTLEQRHLASVADARFRVNTVHQGFE